MKKKALLIFLAILTVLYSILTLSSCAARREKIDLISYYDGGTEILFENGKKIIRFYIDPTAGYDVADFEDVKISFKYEEFRDDYKSTKKDAQIPDGARGNPELQYFYVILDSVDIEEDRPILKIEAKGRLIEELAEENEEEREKAIPSIFLTILIGLIVAAVAIIAACLGLSTMDGFDPRGYILVCIANIVPFCAHFFVYAWWGVARGIIMSVFCAIIVAATVIASRYIDN